MCFLEFVVVSLSFVGWSFLVCVIIVTTQQCKEKNVSSLLLPKILSKSVEVEFKEERERERVEIFNIFI